MLTSLQGTGSQVRGVAGWRRQDQGGHPWSTCHDRGVGVLWQGWYPCAGLEGGDSVQHSHG